MAPLVDFFANRQRMKPARKDTQADKHAAGKLAYSALVLFKGLVLQRMYNLSDVELKEQLRDRFFFSSLCGAWGFR